MTRFDRFLHHGLISLACLRRGGAALLVLRGRDSAHAATVARTLLRLEVRTCWNTLWALVSPRQGHVGYDRDRWRHVKHWDAKHAAEQVRALTWANGRDETWSRPAAFTMAPRCFPVPLSFWCGCGAVPHAHPVEGTEQECPRLMP